MAALKDREEKNNEEKKLFSCLVELLSYEKITFNGEFTLYTLLALSPKFWNFRGLLRRKRNFSEPKNLNSLLFKIKF